MRVVAIARPGGPEVLTVVERKPPSVPFGHVRVALRAAGVNRADLLQRAGFYPAPPGVAPDVPGLEYAGVIDEVGPGVLERKVGERVFGLLAGGAYADLVVAHEREVVPIPARLDDVEAAAVPEVFVTAYDAMVVQAGLRPGERVLIHACASGVGTAAIQIAHQLGCQVIGTTRQADKLARLGPLGLDAGVVPEGGAFAARVRALSDGAGVDVVLDLVGGPYVAESLRACAPRARVVVVGLTGGRETPLDLGMLLFKRVTLVGTVLRARPLEEKIAAALLLRRELSPLLAAGRLRPIVDRVFPLAEAARAHEHVAGDTTVGKVVLRM